MKQRGRVSANHLATVSVLPVQRFDPPADLTPDQSELWRAIVACKPSDWFDAGSMRLLAAYCKAASEHARVSADIDGFDSEWLKKEDGLDRYDRLTKLQDRFATQMVRLATKMRLTQQSKYRADAASVADNQGGGRKPWEFTG